MSTLHTKIKTKIQYNKITVKNFDVSILLLETSLMYVIPQTCLILTKNAMSNRNFRMN